jgi:predicted N-acetyltransferase YhbS
MGTQTIIRPATALDAVNVLKIIRKSDDSLAGDLARADELRAVRHVLDVIEASITLVSEQHGRVVGTIALRPVKDAGVWMLSEEWFAVLPSFRSRREPYELLAECERYADRQGTVIRVGMRSETAAELRSIFTRLKTYSYHDGAYVRRPAGATSSLRTAAAV